MDSNQPVPDAFETDPRVLLAERLDLRLRVG